MSGTDSWTGKAVEKTVDWIIHKLSEKTRVDGGRRVKSSRTRRESDSPSSYASFIHQEFLKEPESSTPRAQATQQKVPASWPRTFGTASPSWTLEKEDCEGGALEKRGKLVKQFVSRCRHKRLEIIQEMLSKNEVDVNCRDAMGNTGIIVAAQNGHRKVIKLLLAYGANINSTNNNGNSALHYSHSYSHNNVTKLLLSAGADTNTRNSHGLLWYEGMGSSRGYVSASKPPLSHTDKVRRLSNARSHSMSMDIIEPNRSRKKRDKDVHITVRKLEENLSPTFEDFEHVDSDSSDVLSPEIESSFLNALEDDEVKDFTPPRRSWESPRLASSLRIDPKGT